MDRAASPMVYFIRNATLGFFYRSLQGIAVFADDD